MPLRPPEQRRSSVRWPSHRQFSGQAGQVVSYAGVPLGIERRACIALAGNRLHDTNRPEAQLVHLTISTIYL
jgi:hypothetical protein